MKRLQPLLGLALTAISRAPILVDGEFGPRPAAAVRRFQERNGVEPTGIADAATWRALEASRRATPAPLPFTASPAVPAGTGSVDLTSAGTSDDRYRNGGDGPRSVAIRSLAPVEGERGTARPIAFTAGMTIDADGKNGRRLDPRNGQNETSLGGLDATKTPYFVLPIGFEELHRGVRLGDIAAVLYKGKVVYAIYGARGPRGQIGEASIATARAGDQCGPALGWCWIGCDLRGLPGLGERPGPLERGDHASRVGAPRQGQGGEGPGGSRDRGARGRRAVRPHVLGCPG
mgnify:CR=1 FL=1